MTKQEILDYVELKYANGFGQRVTQRLSDMLDELILECVPSKASRIVTCVYCGKEYPQDTPTCGAGVEVLTEHIKVCPKHPMRKAEERIRELEEKLEDMKLECKEEYDND